MATPVVSGIVALMLEKNPSLTPNLVKAVLQFTAEDRGYDVMTQGAGYVNAPGALQAASKISASPALYSDGEYWLSAPLSGESTIGGQGVIWVGRILWNYAVLWGGSGAIAFNFHPLWDPAVFWGGAAALECPTLWQSGMTSEAVLWTGNYLTAQAVLWSDLHMYDVVYGEISLDDSK
jgi:subtilisin family serine protease